MMIYQDNSIRVTSPIMLRVITSQGFTGKYRQMSVLMGRIISKDWHRKMLKMTIINTPILGLSICLLRDKVELSLIWIP